MIAQHGRFTRFENCLERLKELVAFTLKYNTFSKALPGFLGLELVLMDSSLRSGLHTGCINYDDYADCTDYRVASIIFSTISSAVSSAKSSTDLLSAASVHLTIARATAVAQK